MPDDGEMTAQVARLEERRDVIVKAYTIGRDRWDIEKGADPQSQDLDTSGSTLNIKQTALNAEIIDPPHAPAVLNKLFEHSNSLRQNVDAYCTNIDGYGHQFDPVIQLQEASSRELVRDALYLERYEAAQSGVPDALTLPLDPSDAEIDARIAELTTRMRYEKAKIESFFQNCVGEESFVSLRRRTRQDREVTGNGYWEVLRNDLGEVSQFVHMPARSMRVTSRREPAIDVSHSARFGVLLFKTETFRRRFRRYVQVGGDENVWFKEYGDPRTVSSASGKTYATPEAMTAEEPNAKPATEVFHFRVAAQTTAAYGVPRWIGNLLSVMGSRAVEEVNLTYFDNKGIPPLAILVSGGRLGEESVKRIQDFVETQLKGRKNFHKILVIEAETTAGAIGLGSENAGTMRVEIKQLTDAQLKDGLFLAYDAANMDKVGMGFRLPRLLRGDIRDFNRASAEAALDFAESQVFAPERNDFDFEMNRHVLTALGIKYWQFKSNGPQLSDAKSWGEVIAALVTAGILTPEDGRRLAGTKVLSQELPVINADWVKQPLPLTIAGVQLDSGIDGLIPLPGANPENPANGAGLGAPGAPGVGDPALPQPSLVAMARKRLTNQAKSLLRLRDAFRKEEAKEAIERYAKEQVEDGEIVFRMSADEIVKRFHISKS